MSTQKNKRKLKDELKSFCNEEFEKIQINVNKQTVNLESFETFKLKRSGSDVGLSRVLANLGGFIISMDSIIKQNGFYLAASTTKNSLNSISKVYNYKNILQIWKLSATPREKCHLHLSIRIDFGFACDLKWLPEESIKDSPVFTEKRGIGYLAVAQADGNVSIYHIPLAPKSVLVDLKPFLRLNSGPLFVRNLKFNRFQRHSKSLMLLGGTLIGELILWDLNVAIFSREKEGEIFLEETKENNEGSFIAHIDKWQAHKPSYSIKSIDWHWTDKFKIVSAADDGVIYIWDLRSRQYPIYFYQSGSPMVNVAWTSDPNFLITRCLSERFDDIRVLNIEKSSSSILATSRISNFTNPQIQTFDLDYKMVGKNMKDFGTLFMAVCTNSGLVYLHGLDSDAFSGGKMKFNSLQLLSNSFKENQTDKNVNYFGPYEENKRKKILSINKSVKGYEKRIKNLELFSGKDLERRNSINICNCKVSKKNKIHVVFASRQGILSYFEKKCTSLE